MNEKRQTNRNVPTDTAGEPGVRLVSSEALLPAGRTLHIEHRGEIYMLRKTRSGKLILTK